VALVIGLMLIRGARSRDPVRAHLPRLALSAAALGALVITVIFLRGGDAGLMERHFRSFGMLAFVAVMVSSDEGWWRRLLLGLALPLAAYGVASHVQRVAASRTPDAFSGTQQLVSSEALDFVREVVAEEGADALVVIPSPELIVAIPLGARVVRTQIEFEMEAENRSRVLRGTVAGTVAILLPTRLEERERGRRLIEAFRDYDPSAWVRHDFGETLVLTQRIQPEP
jgi:hypothetical protein